MESHAVAEGVRALQIAGVADLSTAVYQRRSRIFETSREKMKMQFFEGGTWCT